MVDGYKRKNKHSLPLAVSTGSLYWRSKLAPFEAVVKLPPECQAPSVMQWRPHMWDSAAGINISKGSFLDDDPHYQ